MGDPVGARKKEQKETVKTKANTWERKALDCLEIKKGRERRCRMAAKGLISTAFSGRPAAAANWRGHGGGHWRVCPSCFYIWMRGIFSSACPNRTAALRGANHGPSFSAGGRTHAGAAGVVTASPACPAVEGVV